MRRNCPYCPATDRNCPAHGHFVRACDGRRLRRFRCNNCQGTFSEATTQKCYRQKKRHLNAKIRKLYSSKTSQRRIAIYLNISRATVERKFRFLALEARLVHLRFLRSRARCHSIQFDDLETFEHSKCKPISVTMAVESSTRKILGFRVSTMPAKGHLAKIARKRYGKRIDERSKNRKDLFEELKVQLLPTCEIWSDMSPHYTEDVKTFFPQSTHHTTPGRRGCVVGQGELKGGGHDPLFTLNHTFAMLRDNINRLVRKTWATTKDPKRLEDHIYMYVVYHNTVLT
jgi:transposase-like protein